jgi:tetratricopeptide (TPR) repeat protein
MSRFGNLEFDAPQGEHSDNEPALKDEAAYFAEAEQAFARGEFEAALRRYAKVLEFNPRNSRAWAGQVRMLIELGEFEEAKVWSDKALESFPQEPELLAAKAVALARTGDVQGALAFSDAAVEEQGDTPYVWLARGDVLFARKEKRADYCFEKAGLLAPRNWMVQWLASRIHYYYEKFAVALKFAQQALGLDSAQPAVWLQIGRCQEALGMAALAQTSYRQALELNPQYRQADQALLALRQPGVMDRLRAFWHRLFLK